MGDYIADANTPKKNCPCCGGEARHCNTVTEAYVRCWTCGLTITRKHAQHEDTGIGEAIAAWNRRTEPGAEGP